MPEQVVIIGGGPAGLAAAIQLSRSGIKSVLIEKNELGGLIRNAFRVENYLGFPSGISGLEFVNLIVSQLKTHNLTVISDEVKRLTFKHNEFQIETKTGLIISHYVILATGTKPRTLKVFEDSVFSGKVFFEVASLRTIRNHQIGIIGGGDLAFDFALTLASQGNRIRIFNRNQQTKCLPVLFELVSDQPLIEYFPSRSLSGAVIDQQGLKLSFKTTDRTEDFVQNELLVAIGREPALGLIEEPFRSELDSLLDHNRLFLIGDVNNQMYRQIAIASGDGIRAAMKISRMLRGESK